MTMKVWGLMLELNETGWNDYETELWLMLKCWMIIKSDGLIL